MKLYYSTEGIFVEEAGDFFVMNTDDWDELIASPGLHARVRTRCSGMAMGHLKDANLLAPIVSQQV